MTAANYGELGTGFIGRAGKAFLITRRSVRLPDISGVIVEHPPTPKQWGAWLAYFLRKRIRVALMASRDWYTVPAEWPHLFDAEATIAADMLAGEAFLNGFDPEARDRILIPDDDLGFRVVLPRGRQQRGDHAKQADRVIAATAAKAQMRLWKPTSQPQQDPQAPKSEPSWRAGGSEEFRNMIKDIGQF